MDQDTTQGSGGFGGAGSIKTGGRSTDGGGCFLCGGPHLKKGKNMHVEGSSYQTQFFWADCPQNNQLPPGARSSLASGANATTSTSRAWGERSSWRDRPDDRVDRRRSKEGKPSRENFASDDRSREKNRDFRNYGTGRRRSRSRSSYRSRLDHDNRRRTPPERDDDSFREKKRRLD